MNDPELDEKIVHAVTQYVDNHSVIALKSLIAEREAQAELRGRIDEIKFGKINGYYSAQTKHRAERRLGTLERQLKETTGGTIVNNHEWIKHLVKKMGEKLVKDLHESLTKNGYYDTEPLENWLEQAITAKLDSIMEEVIGLGEKPDVQLTETAWLYSPGAEARNALRIEQRNRYKELKGKI